jgi:1-phosphofructokinase family hexose kinase
MTPLVVSLNPAIDAEWRVTEILAEEKNELISERRWPGGKGVNVSRWLAWLKTPGHLFLPLGGDAGRELAAGLEREGIAFTGFPLHQSTRVNVVITPDPGKGPQYRFNPSWPRVTPREAAGLRRQVMELLERQPPADPMVLSGTLAFGAPADTYARLVRAARRSGRRTVLDCDREPFALAVQEHPWLVKPNEFELAQWAGRRLRTERAEYLAARALADGTGEWVLVSRGAQGAWLIRGDGSNQAWKATAPRVTPRNRVGAGDAMLAGAIAGSDGGDPCDWLRDAVATGTAATQVPPGELPTRALWRRFREAVQVTPLH